MQQDLTILAQFFKLVTWFENNRKQAIWVSASVVVVISFIAYYIWSRGERESDASAALSHATLMAITAEDNGPSDIAAFEKVALQYSGTKAAGFALVQAGTALFSDGKYPEAQAMFERARHEYPDGSFAPQAALGVAASLAAQGQMAEAASAYHKVMDQFPEANTAAPAKFSLAQILESQGHYQEAASLYEAVFRQEGQNSSLGSEAGIRAMEVVRQHPTAAAPPPVAQSGLSSAPGLISAITQTNHLSAATNHP